MVGRILDLENGILWVYEMFLCGMRVCAFFWGGCPIHVDMATWYQRFANPVPTLGMVANKLFDHIYNHHGYRVTEWNQDILARVKLQTYVDAITAKGSPLENRFGFVNGTVRPPISRPGANQRLVYNGHKGFHVLNWSFKALHYLTV